MPSITNADDIASMPITEGMAYWRKTGITLLLTGSYLELIDIAVI